jgi:hypothetical protein
LEVEQQVNCARDATANGSRAALEECVQQVYIEARGIRVKRRENDEKFGRLFRNVPVPEYVLRILRHVESATQYFDDLCRSKDIFESPFHREARRWASIMDDLMFVDKVDITAQGYTHLVDKLHAIEVALGPVTSVDTLHLAIDAAESFDFPVDDGLFSSLRKVRNEARKITARRKRLRRLEKKYGGLRLTFSREVE